MLNGVARQSTCCLTSTGCQCSLFVYLRLMDGQGFAIGSAPEAHRAAYPVVWEVRQCAGTTYSPSPCMLGPTLQASCGNLRSVPRSLACLWMLTRRHTLGLTPRPSKSTALTGICFACRLPPPLNLVRCRAPLSCGWTSCRQRMQHGSQCGTWHFHHQRSLNSGYAHVCASARRGCVSSREPVVRCLHPMLD